MCFMLDLFESQVIRPFADTYARGLTPNPCVNCNVIIKFGYLLDYAREHGCDYLTTGHYARLVDIDGTTMLCRPNDSRKDQSYFLWHIDPSLYRYMMASAGGYQEDREYLLTLKKLACMLLIKQKAKIFALRAN